MSRLRLTYAAGLSAVAVLCAPMAGATPEVTSGTPSSGACGATFSDSSTGEVCLSGIVATSVPLEGEFEPGASESMAVAADAIQQVVAGGDPEQARSFIDNAAGDLTEDQINFLEEVLSRALDKASGGPAATKLLNTGERSGQTKLRSSRPSAQIAATAGYGNPKFQTLYFNYAHARSDGTVSIISVTKVEFFHYIGVDSSDWGVKALAVHLTKYSGRDTYYSDVICQIRHVDWFSDSTVLTWGKCSSPDHNSVNNFDVYRYERNYYGNRGDKYYNEMWFDVNPEGATYDTIRANLEGPKWKNPDGGGEPYWL